MKGLAKTCARLPGLRRVSRGPFKNVRKYILYGSRNTILILVRLLSGKLKSYILAGQHIHIFVAPKTFTTKLDSLQGVPFGNTSRRNISQNSSNSPSFLFQNPCFVLVIVKDAVDHQDDWERILVMNWLIKRSINRELSAQKVRVILLFTSYIWYTYDRQYNTCMF